jgi:hypothetical protein
MNEPRPRRFSKYRDGVSLQEYLEKIFNLKFEAADKALVEARRIMEDRMAGFPQVFLQKGEVEAELKLLKAELKQLSKANDQMEGKASQRSMIITLTIAVISLLITGFVAVAGVMRHFKL